MTEEDPFRMTSDESEEYHQVVMEMRTNMDNLSQTEIDQQAQFQRDREESIRQSRLEYPELWRLIDGILGGDTKRKIIDGMLFEQEMDIQNKQLYAPLTSPEVKEYFSF